MLDALHELYQAVDHTVATCTFENAEKPVTTKFDYAFSLCLSEDGGVMAFGGPNTAFHLEPVELGTPKAAKYRIPLIAESNKAPSYSVGLTGVRIVKSEQFSPDLNSSKILTISEKSNTWDDIELNPGSRLQGTFSRMTEGNDFQTELTNHLFVTPTLIDSGTTLSFMPPGLFKRVLDAISERVAANSRVNQERASERRLQKVLVSPEDLFGIGTRRVDRFSKSRLVTEDRQNIVEFIPLTSQPLMASPKRLIKLSALERTSIIRSMRGRINEAFVAKESGGRRLEEADPGWYAVLEPVGRSEEPELVGFLDIPGWMEPARPRTLVSKLEGYNNGECWWLQDKSELRLFPMMGFDFVGNVTVVWHPRSYMYSGTNDHFWCLAIMTEGGNETGVDKEVIFGSNSFVHHDMIFESYKAMGEADQEGQEDGDTSEVNSSHRVIPDAAVYIVPAICPMKALDRV